MFWQIFSILVVSACSLPLSPIPFAFQGASEVSNITDISPTPPESSELPSVNNPFPATQGPPELPPIPSTFPSTQGPPELPPIPSTFPATQGPPELPPSPSTFPATQGPPELPPFPPTFPSTQGPPEVISTPFPFPGTPELPPTPFTFPATPGPPEVTSTPFPFPGTPELPPIPPTFPATQKPPELPTMVTAPSTPSSTISPTIQPSVSQPTEGPIQTTTGIPATSVPGESATRPSALPAVVKPVDGNCSNLIKGLASEDTQKAGEIIDGILYQSETDSYSDKDKCLYLNLASLVKDGLKIINEVCGVSSAERYIEKFNAARKSLNCNQYLSSTTDPFEYSLEN